MLENDTLRFVDRETEKARLATYLFKYAEKLHFLCPNGEIGRRDRFKICFLGVWVRIPLWVFAARHFAFKVSNRFSCVFEHSEHKKLVFLS